MRGGKISNVSIEGKAWDERAFFSGSGQGWRGSGVTGQGAMISKEAGFFSRNGHRKKPPPPPYVVMLEVCKV